MIDITPSIESATLQQPVSTNKTANNANASAVAKTENVKAEQIVAQVQGVQSTERTAIAPEELTQVVESLNSIVQTMKRNISFDVDKDSGRVVISVSDSDTKELIRQIPSEDALKLLKRMDAAVGLLFSEKV